MSFHFTVQGLFLFANECPYAHMDATQQCPLLESPKEDIFFSLFPLQADQKWPVSFLELLLAPSSGESPLRLHRPETAK